MMATSKNKTNVVSRFDCLPYNVHFQLVQRQTAKGDLPILLDAKWQWTQDAGRYNDHTKEDMLVYILDLLECNGIDSVTKLTMEEWSNLVK